MEASTSDRKIKLRKKKVAQEGGDKLPFLTQSDDKLIKMSLSCESAENALLNILCVQFAHAIPFQLSLKTSWTYPGMEYKQMSIIMIREKTIK